MQLARFALNGGGVDYLSDWIFLTSSSRKTGSCFCACRLGKHLPHSAFPGRQSVGDGGCILHFPQGYFRRDAR